MPHTAPGRAHRSPCSSAVPTQCLSPPHSISLSRLSAAPAWTHRGWSPGALSLQPAAPELCRAGCSLPSCTQQDPSAPSSYSLTFFGPRARGFDIIFIFSITG